MDTYLATFLTCWLCAFVLPLRYLGCIRLSVFKLASQLASERRISLAIPIQACIYKGLSELSHSSIPGKRVRTLACKDAKSSISSGKDINWVVIAPNDVAGDLKPPLEKITLKYSYSLFYISVRVGTRFSFVIPARGLKMNLRATDNYTSWWKSMYSSSISPTTLPSPTKSSEDRISKSQKRKVEITPSYNKGVKAARDSYEKSNLKVRITHSSSTGSLKEPSTQNTKGGQSRSPSQSSKDGKPSKDQDRTVLEDIFNGFDSFDETLSDEELREMSDIIHDIPMIPVGTPSFSTRGIISSTECYAICFMVNSIRDRVLGMSLCYIHGLENEIKKMFDYINAKNIDLPGLREHVNNYIKHASTFRTLKQKHKGQTFVQDLKDHLLSLEFCLSKAAHLQKKDEEKSTRNV
ncbi:Methylthioribose-1-phosphate isomerase [Bienertia sinuspersici]